jgi:hypothetical protein
MGAGVMVRQAFRVGIAAFAIASAQAALTAQPVETGAGPTAPLQGAVSQCITQRTIGLDRPLLAQWMFAAMATSPSIAELAAVTHERRAELDRTFAELMTRIVTKDCSEQLIALAAADPENAYLTVLSTLDDIAVQELRVGALDTDKPLDAYEKYLNQEDFKALDKVIDKAIDQAQGK